MASGEVEIPEEEAAAHEQALSACRALYGARDEARRAEADLWLRAFARHGAAWTFADTALAGGPPEHGASGLGPAAAAELRELTQQQFLGAQILLIKLRWDFRELTGDGVAEQVRDRLLEHLHVYSGMPVVRGRLAMCIAAFAVHTSWDSVVDDVAAIFENWREDADTAKCLAAVATAIPEECHDRDGAGRHVSLDTFERYSAALSRTSPTMLRLLVEMLGSIDNTDVQNELLRCLKAWVKYCRIPAEQLGHSELGLVPATFSALSMPDLFEGCVDLIEQMIRTYCSNSGGDDPVVEQLMHGVAELDESLHSAIKSEDEDAVRGVSRLIALTMETYSALIISDSDVGQGQLLGMLGTCSGYLDLDIASMTFKGWFALTDEFREVMTSNPALASGLQPRLQPSIEALVPAVLQHAVFPSDFSDWSSDAQDDFVHKTRYDLADLLLDSCVYIGSSAVLGFVRDILAEQTGALLERLAGDPESLVHDNSSSPDSWQRVEVALFAIRSVARQIEADERDVLPPSLELCQTLAGMVQAPPLLRATALRLLGRYSEWMLANSSYFGPTFDCLVAAVVPDEDAKVLAAAGIALKGLCKHGAKTIAARALSASEAVAHLEHESVLDVTEAVCSALSSLPVGECQDALMTLAGPVVGVLEHSVDESVDGAFGPEASEAVVLALKKLTMMARHTCVNVGDDGAHPVTGLLEAMWDVLQAVSHGYGASDAVAEQICRLFKHAMRNCRRHFAHVVEHMLKHVEEAFAAEPKSSYMYLVGTCISEYGRFGDAIVPTIMGTVQQLAKPALHVLTSGDMAEQIREHPDVAEDLFRIVTRSFEECPDAACHLEDPILPSAIQLGSIAMSVRHQEANQAAFAMLEAIFDCLRPPRHNERAPEGRTTALEPLLDEFGPVFAHGVVSALSGALPYTCIDDPNGSLSAALYELVRLNPDHAGSLLRDALAEQVPEHVVPPAGRDDFLGHLLDSRSRMDMTHPLQMMYDTIRRAKEGAALA